MATTTIGSGGGDDYSTVSGWEAGTQGDLVTAAEGEVGELQDETVTESGDVTWAGATTNATYYRRLTAASGAEYDPIADSGSSINFTSGDLELGENYLEIDHVGVWVSDNTYNSSGGVVGFNSAATNVHMHSVCVRGDKTTTTGTSSRHVRIVSGSNHRVYDCIVIGGGASTGVYLGFEASGAYLTAYANNIAYNTRRRGFNGVPAVSRNLISMNSATGGDFNNTVAGADYLCASDTTTIGSNSLNSQTATDIFNDPANDDFRLKSGSNAIDAGDDMSSDFTTDFEGNTHGSGGTWDMGAYDESATPAAGGAEQQFLGLMGVGS